MNILILLVYAEFCLLYFLIKEGFAQYSFLAKFGVWSKRMLLCRSVNQRSEGPELNLGSGGSTFWWLLKVMVIKTVPFIAKVQILSHLDRAFGCFTWDSYFFIPKRDSSPNIFPLIYCLSRTYASISLDLGLKSKHFMYSFPLSVGPNFGKSFGAVSIK